LGKAGMYPQVFHRFSKRRWPKTTGISFAAILALLASGSTASAKDDIELELNKLETVKDVCKAYFLIEEKAGKPLQSLKADLIIFGQDGSIAKRLIAEMGPVRSRKTSVKIFALEVPCPEISGVLLNDVASCAPEATSEACLDRLAVSSRLATRFYK
jgi:hypothetical protein